MINYKDRLISLVQGDITEQAVDGIVNAANNSLLGGGGVDGAIHRAGGSLILDQCKKIGGCPTGEARISVGGNLPAKYVIHTVGPIYKDGNSGEETFLYNAYYNSLKLASDYNLKSIAFPSISTGAYGYPIEKASSIALKAVKDFLEIESSIKEIRFVLFNDIDYSMYLSIIEEYFVNII